MVDTPKICKCGHDKLDHYKHPEKLIKSPGPCQACPCTIYMNRRRPDTSDKILALFGFGFIGMIAWMAITPFVSTGFDLNTTVPIPAKTLFILSGGIIALFCCYVVIPYIIGPYFEAKKRKEFPVSTNL